MNLKCGIIGLPNVGKSTLFNAFTNLKVPDLNFPFCTISPNIGFVPIFDKRILKIDEIINSKKITPCSIKVIDIAGLIRNSSKGEGLGNKFLKQIGEVDVLLHVVRSFTKNDIIHVVGDVNPYRDIEIVNLELLISDLTLCEKILMNLLKKRKKNNEIDIFILKKALKILKKDIFLKDFNFSIEEKNILNNYKFLTIKPVIYLLNHDFSESKKFDILKKKFFKKKMILKKINLKKIKKNKKKIIFKNLKKNSSFLYNSSLNKIILLVYKMLNLNTFFTVGKEEIRSWSFLKDSNCLNVSKIIHSDFYNGFIKAKVMSYKDFILYKSEKNVKNVGKLRYEGKSYKVQDGDIIHFLFNV